MISSLVLNQNIKTVIDDAGEVEDTSSYVLIEYVAYMKEFVKNGFQITVNSPDGETTTSGVFVGSSILNRVTIKLTTSPSGSKSAGSESRFPSPSVNSNINEGFPDVTVLSPVGPVTGQGVWLRPAFPLPFPGREQEKIMRENNTTQDNKT